MSSLWTPGGEHPVDRPRADRPRDQPTDASGAAGGREGDTEEIADDDIAARAEALQAEVDEVRAQLAKVPAAQVVANHAMGLFELAAIHLSLQPPQLGEAVLAIDAMATLVEGLGERLGEATPTLHDALAQIRMAFVQVKASNAPA